LVNPKLVTGTIEIEAQKVELAVKAAELPIDLGQIDLKLELPPFWIIDLCPYVTPRFRLFSKFSGDH